MFRLFLILVLMTACTSKRGIVYEHTCRVVVGQESIDDHGEYEINEDCVLKAAPKDQH